MSEPFVRWRLVATGTVQMVNYRERVVREARKRKLVGQVENDPKDDERVEILAQGGPAALEEFRLAIAGREGRSDAEEVSKVEEMPVDPSLTRFRRIKGAADDETQERLEFAGAALTDLTVATKAGFSSLGKEMKGGFSTLSRETHSVGQSVEKVGRSVDRVGQSVGGVERSVEKVGHLVAKGNLATEALHRDTTRRFDEMGQAYGIIGKSLSRIERDLGEQVKATQAQTRALLQVAREMSRTTKALSRAGVVKRGGAKAPSRGRR